jgi:predicted DNA-binding transcriptional regulator YafY
MRLNNIEEMERWVLSWGVHARAVRPRTLAERIRKIAVELAGYYGES